MNLIETERSCGIVESETCDWVFDQTGNEALGVAAAWLIGKPLAVLAIILLAVLLRWVLHRVIDRLVVRASGGVVPSFFRRAKADSSQAVDVHHSIASARRVQRAKAMGSLLKSVGTGLIFAVATIMALSEVELDVAPLIASAGIVGVALGFGAQSLVKDFLSGIFMVFEDQYGVGDVIDAGEASGTVEAVGLRVTRLRDVNGTVWYVRNGEILRVGNMSQNWARTVLDIPVAYTEDLHRVRSILQDVAHDLWEDEDFKGKVIEEPEVWGVERLDPDSIAVRVTLKTAPLEQWAVARTMRERVKARFDFEGIEIPLPQRVVWHRDAPEPAPGEAASGASQDTGSG